MRPKTPVKRPTQIPLLALQMAVFNSKPTRTHKEALANLRANLAEAVYRASKPKAKVRL